jgi:hypothetical protein
MTDINYQKIDTETALDNIFHQPSAQQGTTSNTTTTPNAVPMPLPVQAPASEPTSEVEAPAQKKPKLFSRDNVKKSIDLKFTFPIIDPDIVFGFKLRLKLSREADDRRQTYVGLSAVKQTETVTQQALDEICDLLVELPTGFEDLHLLPSGPGESLRNYYETTTDPYAKEFIGMVIEAADVRYWNAITPREFRG